MSWLTILAKNNHGLACRLLYVVVLVTEQRDDCINGLRR
jgi:hypothetical protein